MESTPTPPLISSYVALGDSFTEGMSDRLPDGTYRGWADLLAARLGARTDGFRYANLAVRGKLIQQITEAQVPVAAEMKPDLVTFVGGGNDTLRPRCDMARVRALLEESVETLAPACGQLVLMCNPARNGPVQDRYRDRMEALFALVEELAGRHGAVLVDLYTGDPLGDQRFWADDRLHLTEEGHRRVAEAVWQRLGNAAESDWRSPLPPSARQGWTERRRTDLRFTREHLAPWVVRRLTGRSSGDGRPPKRPELAPWPGEDTP
ncbi:SGNH/GDSL hydrolase family protein [Streptomyces sp. NPDC054784]